MQVSINETVYSVPDNEHEKLRKLRKEFGTAEIPASEISDVEGMSLVGKGLIEQLPSGNGKLTTDGDLIASTKRRNGGR